MFKSLSLMIAVLAFGLATSLQARTPMENLTQREQDVVHISKHTARGDIVGLKSALVRALDAGLTVNETKEILVQLYAYCGFPRSLNALNTLMRLLEERQAQGKHDNIGALPSALPSSEQLLKLGTENQTRLCGAPVKGALFDFAPAIDAFLKAHLFGDIFGRDNLDWRTREIATIAALAVLPGADSQLQSHLAIGRNNGVTSEQAEAILALARGYEPAVPYLGPFPVGEPNVAYAKYFSGKSYLARLAGDKRLKVPVANVTFEPSCRNNWHSHTGGQILVAVGGRGLYQERGQNARLLLPGDVVEIPPHVEHWHGATPDSWFSHLAIECQADTNKNTWLEPVGEADYQQAAAHAK